jgi:hypothetical protein
MQERRAETLPYQPPQLDTGVRLAQTRTGLLVSDAETDVWGSL